jgi:hypothetical protein
MQRSTRCALIASEFTLDFAKRDLHLFERIIARAARRWKFPFRQFGVMEVFQEIDLG